jgi:hypothetical protein
MPQDEEAAFIFMIIIKYQAYANGYKAVSRQSMGDILNIIMNLRCQLRHSLVSLRTEFFVTNNRDGEGERRLIVRNDAHQQTGSRQE